MKKILIIFMSIAVIVSFLFMGGCGKKEVKPEGPYDAEKFLTDADNLVSKKEYDEARKVLLEVKNRDSQKKYGAIAQLKIADSYSKEGEPELAIAEYRKFIDLYPDNQYASYAQYQIGMSYYSQIESPDRGSGAARDALVEFNRLKQLYPRNPYRDVVELRIERAKTVISDGDFMIGEFYFNKESYQAAIDRLEGLLKKYPDYKKEDKALLIIGKSYKGLKKNDKAKEVFARLIEKYPTSDAAKEAKKLISK
ncbi:MAG TPA: outer membrane protein assembly factor BamD [Dissulfurispiraceae bacterium]|nr:outer membrane protein assembly factor BamD [Dissulfurispiraceae bacterium]